MSIIPIIFFADRLPPLIGGMEIHAKYFIEYFTAHHKFSITEIVTKDLDEYDCLIIENKLQRVNISDLATKEPLIIFFNSGRWIEELGYIKTIFPNGKFIYRTGGNEILKAPLNANFVKDHSLRQTYWTNVINDNIDLLITNSIYTENRLKNQGIITTMARCVGGVNSDLLQPAELKYICKNLLIIFCAARFVPYKNHIFLLKLLHQLLMRGNKLQLRLAGDGPLLNQVQKLAVELGITSSIKFLGVLSNEETCYEIVDADIYMQFSIDYLTKVPEGEYIHSEGMGRSILEAITAGTFIIAGKGGALAEIINSDNGILVDLNDLNHAVNVVEPVIKNIPAKLSFSDKYSWNNIFRLYEEIFAL